MIGHISLAYYRVTFVPEDIILMPRLNKGNVLRGAFGSSLRRLICALPSSGQTVECAHCSLREGCPYSLIFNPVGLNPAKRLRTPPRGYVIKPPLEEETRYQHDRPLRFGMVLIGDRVRFLPYLIVTLQELGRWGIGLNRGRFTLGRLEALTEREFEPIYDPLTHTVLNVEAFIRGDQILERAKDFDEHEVTIHFLTPTRIKYNPTGERDRSDVVRVPEFHHLLRRLRDRISALSSTYCGKPLEIDFQGIAERARSVKTRRVTLRWVERTRKSIHDQSGFVGRITYGGSIREFLPLLLLGEYVHLGEDAVFGHGWYEIEGKKDGKGT